MLGSGLNSMLFQYGPSSDAEEMCCLATAILDTLHMPDMPAVNVTNTFEFMLQPRTRNPTLADEKPTARIKFVSCAAPGEGLRLLGKRQVAQEFGQPVVHAVANQQDAHAAERGLTCSLGRVCAL